MQEYALSLKLAKQKNRGGRYAVYTIYIAGVVCVIRYLGHCHGYIQF